MRLAYEWLRIGLSYGDARAYALLSLSPYLAVLVVGLAAGGLAVHEYREDRLKELTQAENYWIDIGTPMELTTVDYLNKAPRGVKWAFLDIALASGDTKYMSRFESSKDRIINAVIGPRGRYRPIAREVFSARCGTAALSHNSAAYVSACLALAATQSAEFRRDRLDAVTLEPVWIIRLQKGRDEIRDGKKRADELGGGTPEGEQAIRSVRILLVEARQWALNLLVFYNRLSEYHAGLALESLLEVLNHPYCTISDETADLEAIKLLKKRAARRLVEDWKRDVAQRAAMKGTATPPLQQKLLKDELVALNAP